MATAADMIEETLGHLYSGTREQLNMLAAPYTAGGTSLTFHYDLRGIQDGAIVAIDQELFCIMSVSGSDATVLPACDGSLNADHPIDSKVYVNPRFDRFRVLQALNHELASLSTPDKGLFQPLTLELTYQPVYQGYDLAGVTNLEKILAVRAERVGSERGWDTLGRTDYELQRDHDIGDFASGYSLQLLRGDPGKAVTVVYAAPFGSLADEAADPVADAGLPETALDIPPLGAALRLAWPTEIPRNDFRVQGEPRRAEEVPPGANANAGVGLARLYQARCNEEASRLSRRYPHRRYA